MSYVIFIEIYTVQGKNVATVVNITLRNYADFYYREALKSIKLRVYNFTSTQLLSLECIRIASSLGRGLIPNIQGNFVSSLKRSTALLPPSTISSRENFPRPRTSDKPQNGPSEQSQIFDVARGQVRYRTKRFAMVYVQRCTCMHAQRT